MVCCDPCKGGPCEVRARCVLMMLDGYHGRNCGLCFVHCRLCMRYEVRHRDDRR